MYCLESEQYVHICRPFMCNNTFEALFLTSKCSHSGFVWTQTVAPHRSFCMAAQRRYSRFRSAWADSSSRIAPNCEYFNNHLMQYVPVLRYFYVKSEIYRTHGTMKSPIPPSWSVDFSATRAIEPLAPRGSNVHFYPFQCWAMKRCVKFNNK